MSEDAPKVKITYYVKTHGKSSTYAICETPEEAIEAKGNAGPGAYIVRETTTTQVLNL
jgi:hypothetical protein